MVLLHVGAHKTATTLLQSALERHGTAFTPVDRNGEMHPARNAIRNDLFLRLTYWQRRRVRRQFQRLAPTRLTVVSDENALGIMADLFRGNFYADCADRVLNFMRNTGLPVSRIFVSIRDYAAFFESVYAFQSGRVVLPEDARERLLSLKRGWPEVVSDLQSTGIPVTVWRHETFDLGDRLRDLGLSPMEGGHANGSPSREAIVHLQALRERGPLTYAQLCYLRDAFPGERFSLWTPEERAALSERYARNTTVTAPPV